MWNSLLGNAPPDRHLLFHLEILECLMLKVDLSKDFPAAGVRTRFGTRGEKALDTALAGLMIAWRDEQAKAFVELPVGLANGALVVVGLTVSDQHVSPFISRTRERREAGKELTRYSVILLLASRIPAV